MMGAFTWMVCLFISINAVQLQDPLQHLRQEMNAIRNECLEKIEEQDRKIEQLEHKEKSNTGNYWWYLFCL